MKAWGEKFWNSVLDAYHKKDVLGATLEGPELGKAVAVEHLITQLNVAGKASKAIPSLAISGEVSGATRARLKEVLGRKVVFSLEEMSAGRLADHSSALRAGLGGATP